MQKIYDAAMVRGDGGIERVGAMRLERGQCPRLVVTHQAAIADHVGDEDGREPPFNTFSQNADLLKDCQNILNGMKNDWQPRFKPEKMSALGQQRLFAAPSKKVRSWGQSRRNL